MDSAFLTVGYDDFARLDLRIGTIVEAKIHPRSTATILCRLRWENRCYKPSPR